MNKGLVTDFYQLTMAQGLWRLGAADVPCVFERIYRENPFHGGYTVVAGVEHLVDFVADFRYGPEEIEYLQSTGAFCDEFLDWLSRLHFTGNIDSMPEGTVAFPGEVILRVEAPKAQAMLLETGLSMIMNHETLIATKARRIRQEAGDDFLMEFGLRRAQGESAGHYGARAAIVGGFDATSNVEAARRFGLPAVGTMAHSWVMSFASELESFREYARQYDNATLLVDTYDTLHSGVPNAIRVFEELRAAGRLPKIHGVRLDSGDLAYLSKAARAMLDEAGFTDAGITASNDIDEYLLRSLKEQGASITAWGIGTQLITAKGSPSLGGIYKLAAQEENGRIVPKMKFSDNPEKMTNPGKKEVRRVYHRRNGKMITDVLCLEGEEISAQDGCELVSHPYHWRRKTLEPNAFFVRDMLQPVIRRGEAVFDRPSLAAIRTYGDEEIATLWPEYLRLDNPEIMEVNLSKRLQELRDHLIEENVERSRGK